MQRNGVFSAQECDHYDHVGAARLAKSALAKSGLSIALYEYRTYDMAAGLLVNSTISTQACQRFCGARDTYLRYDTLAAATPWGALLTAPDRFTLGNISSGGGRIQSQIGGGTLCLSGENGSIGQGAFIVSNNCNNAPSMLLTSSGALQLGNNCIGLNGLVQIGVKLTVQACNGGDAQRWRYNASAGRIEHVASGWALDIPYGSTTPGVRVEICPAHTSANQRWNFMDGTSPAPNSSAVIRSVLPSRLCLGSTSGLTNGAVIRLVDCANAITFVKGSDGTYSAGGLCLDVANPTGISLVRLTTCNGGAQQRFEQQGTASS